MTSTVKRVVLIANPISGNGRGFRAAERAKRALSERGTHAELLATERAGDARAFAAELDPACDAIIAVGGDGTLNEVISGLRRPVPVGIIPVGTANVVARELGIPRDPERAVDVLLRGVPTPWDSGTVNGRPFLAMVGIGFDGAIVKAICERRRGPIGMATYVAPALQTLLRFRPTPLRLTIDNVEFEHPVFGAIITNTRNYGGLFSVTPDARPNDGRLHFVAHRKGGRLPLLRCFLAAMTRSHASPHVAAYGSGVTFRVESDVPCPVEADGDYVGMTPVTLEIRPHSVTLLAPPKAHP